MTPCWLAKFDPEERPCLFRADGRPDRAHLVPAQRLRNAGINPDDPLDQRCVVPACRRHHELWDKHHFYISLTDYPESFMAYATEHGLTWNPDRKQWRVWAQREAA